MKRIYFIMALLCLALSCQKQSLQSTNESSYLEVVKKDLQQSLSSDDFTNLDFSHAHLSQGDSGRLFYLQVPFKNKGEFVLLKTNSTGNIEKGKIIQINTNTLAKPLQTSLNGDIVIQSLSRDEEISSPIKSGFIQTLHKNDSTIRVEVTPDPYVELPEVIVVSSYSSGGISWSTWYSVMDMLGGSGGGGGGGEWYAPAATNTGGGSGGGTVPITTPGGTATVPTEQMIYISQETQINNPTVNLQNIVDCFNTIPDNGSVCKITIHSDLPVNGDPTKFFNFDLGSPGHTWLRFEKSNLGQNISQHVGFYPARDWKLITSTGPIPGKFVDNGNHEFNASYEVTITPAQLKVAFTRMLSLQEVQYDIDNYNCSDWALEVFNQAVNPDQKLTIPKFIIGTANLDGSNTPQGLFIQLRNMMKKGPPAGGRIDLVLGYSGNSSAPCKYVY